MNHFCSLMKLLPQSSAIRVISITVAILAICILWLLFGPIDPSSAPRAASIQSPYASSEIVFPVEVSIVHRGDLVNRLSTTGTVRANRDVEVVARVSGQIISVQAYNGKYVQAGEILVGMEDREFRSAFERAASNLLGAQIEYRSMSNSPYRPLVDSIELQQQLDDARRKFREAEAALHAGSSTEESFLRSKREYEANEAYLKANRGDVIANKSGLAQAKEAYETAKLNLEATEVRAPFSGYVANCDLAPGARVQTGRSLFSIVDVSTLLVDVEVLENEVARISPGQSADASVSGLPGRIFPGVVRTMNPLIDVRTKTMKITIALSGKRGKGESDKLVLRPGMFASVNIVTGVVRQQLLVPRNALLIRDQRTLLFTKESDLAKWHYVDTGDENDEYVVIKSGIIPGDTVITGGHFTLAHDARINVVRHR